MWPFKKTQETRSSGGEGYTESKILDLEAQAKGAGNSANSTAAISTAASLVGRCLSVAKVEPAKKLAFPLNPSILLDLGRALIEEGEAVYRINVLEDGKLELQRASSWTISGSAPYYYQLKLPEPTGGPIEFATHGDGVFHPRINAYKSSPWRGRGAAELAGSTARLLGSLEKCMANELGKGSGYIIPMPGLTPGEVDNLQKKLVGLKGGSILVPSSTFSHDTPQSANNYKPSRVGANFPDTYSVLRKDLHESLLNSIGIPLSLFGSGSSSREGLRFFLHTALSPLISAIEIEAQRKLNKDARFDLKQLFAADVVGRSRAFSSMVKAGMPVEKAAALSGLITVEEDN